ncbi:interferon-induced 35 kDa protein isoform X2 [Physeter macrocephalus]|uniref:Interferon-induced 35 kDa protein isoform X2 n=1 Tax=Physeter macrocephalus TaxID=9755 RepID=A0A455AYQ5_PHYMC|nr:interferon-induced 35 kDa protein isoform X2 [Physeter catodon]|eukprot:XP_028341359.1 interferon-induced 35 kDa protein isoform X2 [Physeter catodon]
MALQALQEEQAKLKTRLQELKRKLRDNPQDKVPFPVPEATLVFRGDIQQGKETAKSVVSHLRICYPLPGGSALVTFDDPNVAKQVLQQTEHTINVEGFRLRVQVQPLELPMLTTIQVSSQMNEQRVLVSGFPAGLKLSEEELLDKLEIFFGKSKNGGGDVETRELLQGSVMLGFAKDTVAQHLCQTGQFTVPLGLLPPPILPRSPPAPTSAAPGPPAQPARAPAQLPAPFPGQLPASAPLGAGAQHSRCPGWPGATRRAGDPLPEAHPWGRGGGSRDSHAPGTAGPGGLHCQVGLGACPAHHPRPSARVLKPGWGWTHTQEREIMPVNGRRDCEL